jgi:hypothetical protein
MELASAMVLRIRSTPSWELRISATIRECPDGSLSPVDRSERVLRGGGAEAALTEGFPPMNHPSGTAIAKAQAASGKIAALDRVGFIF